MEHLSPESELGHVRCFTCNKIIGHKYNEYEKLLSEGKSIEEALNKLKIVRYCCRKHFINPFKVVVEKLEESSEMTTFEKLSVANDPNINTNGALSSLASSSILVEPESEIQLKPVKALPTFSKKTEDKTTRIYKAW